MSDTPPLYFTAHLGMLTPKLLRALLAYDPETGLFTWNARPVDFFRASIGAVNRPVEWSANKWNTRYAGKPALTKALPGGYLGGSILNTPVRAHRIAWAIYWGAWPEGEIDHINGQPADNRILNLRDVSHCVNMRNQKRYSNSKSGVTGVSWYEANQRWVAEIQHNNKRKVLGSFKSFGAAVTARRVAERDLGFHENHGRHND